MGKHEPDYDAVLNLSYALVKLVLRIKQKNGTAMRKVKFSSFSFVIFWYKDVILNTANFDIKNECNSYFNMSTL